MSAVIINNAKIFLQLMSKSRSLARISERKLAATKALLVTLNLIPVKPQLML